MDLIDNPNAKFDILSYLNNMYMAKMTPTIDVQNAGGHYNRMNDNDSKNDEDKKILEINKKRIDIPDAEIKYFQYQSQEQVTEYNGDGTTEDSTATKQRGRKNGKRYNEISDETEQTGRFGESLTEEVIEI